MTGSRKGGSHVGSKKEKKKQAASWEDEHQHVQRWGSFFCVDLPWGLNLARSWPFFRGWTICFAFLGTIQRRTMIKKCGWFSLKGWFLSRYFLGMFLVINKIK